MVQNDVEVAALHAEERDDLGHGLLDPLHLQLERALGRPLGLVQLLPGLMT